jgi:hypothetical protein
MSRRVASLMPAGWNQMVSWLIRLKPVVAVRRLQYSTSCASDGEPAAITEGARRLLAARLDEGPKPEDLALSVDRM